MSFGASWYRGVRAGFEQALVWSLVVASFGACGRTRGNGGIVEGEGGDGSQGGTTAGSSMSSAGSQNRAGTAGLPSEEGGAPAAGAGAAAGEGGLGGAGAAPNEGGAGGERGGEAGSGGEGGAIEPTEPCILRVKPTGSDLNDGSSWTSAFGTLEGALVAASNKATADAVCQIWVAEGTYAPQPWGGDASTLRVPDGVEMYGGFLGTEATLSERAGSRTATIVTGIPAGGGERLHPVLTTNGKVRLDQLTIRDGESSEQGGGIVCENGNLLLSEAVVRLNVALEGGGLFVRSACVAQVQSSEFASNGAGRFDAVDGGRGGAIYSSGRLTVRGGKLTSNFSGGRGGGIYTVGNTDIVDVELVANVLESTVGPVYGGAIYAEGADGAETRIRGCAISASSVKGEPAYGSGVAGKALVIQSTELTGNTARSSDVWGGGIYATGSLVLEDSTLTRNGGTRPATTGGGVYFEDGGLKVRRTQFFSNQAPLGSQLRCAAGCRAKVSASFDAGTSPASNATLFFDGGTLDLVDSVVRDGKSAGLRVEAPNGTLRAVHVTMIGRLIGPSIEHVSGNFSFLNSVAASDVPPGYMDPLPSQIHSPTPLKLDIRNSAIPGICTDLPTLCDRNLDGTPTYAPLPYPAGDSVVVNAADARLLPEDFLDLDDDGNLTESLPVDLDGKLRVVGLSPDMGAYEVP